VPAALALEIAGGGTALMLGGAPTRAIDVTYRAISPRDTAQLILDELPSFPLYCDLKRPQTVASFPESIDRRPCRRFLVNQRL
jgi:hypothetical protein